MNKQDEVDILFRDNIKDLNKMTEYEIARFFYKKATARHEEEIAEYKKRRKGDATTLRHYAKQIEKLSYLLDETVEGFEELLIEAKNLYKYYLNAFRKTSAEYFAEKTKNLQKIKESR